MDEACSDIEARVAILLFGIADVGELPRAIDAVLEDDGFFRLHRRLSRFVTSEMVRTQAAQRRVPDAILSGAGTRNAALVARAATYVQAAAQAALQFVGWLAKNDPAALAQAQVSSRTSRPLAFMRERNIPPAIKRALLARERAEVCAIGLAAAADHDVPPALVDELAALWVAHQREYLRFAGSLPGVDLPSDVFPASERLDIRALEQRTRTANTAYDESLAAARASGAPVFPIPDVIGDD